MLESAGPHAPNGAIGYVINGKMTLGFAVVAWPADYENSGVMTFLMGPDGPKVIHIGYLPATVEEVYFPHAELIRDVGPSLALLADASKGSCRGRARCLNCARRSLPGSPIAPTRAAIRRPRSASCATCGR